MRHLRALATVALVGLTIPAQADTADDLEALVGYTIVASKRIEGYVDDGKREDGFEGCEYGRRIVFTDGTYITCSSYGYQYAYWPTAVLLGQEIRGTTVWKMVVGDDVYDVY